MLRILVTNDDGILATGLACLAATLSGLGEVYVVAPERERSATGHAITVHKPLRSEAVALPHTAAAHWVSGTPSDCVKLALEALLPGPPDLLISGINRGLNLGTDVIYSGTVSAAREGVIHGIPSLAVSLDATGEADFRPAARVAARLARGVAARGLPPGVLLNVNVPRGTPRGLRVTRLGFRRYRDVLERRIDPRGRSYFWLAGKVEDLDHDPDVDTVAVRGGYVSVTPIRLDLTCHELIPVLREWELDLGAGEGREVREGREGGPGGDSELPGCGSGTEGAT